MCPCAEDTAALQQQHQQLLPDTASAALPMEASGVLGTSFYISPEIANGWPQYDNKVDLYSLGVIAFELWHPFTTGMERVMVLRDLVEKGTLPPGWPEAHPGVGCVPKYMCVRICFIVRLSVQVQLGDLFFLGDRTCTVCAFVTSPAAVHCIPCEL